MKTLKRFFIVAFAMLFLGIVSQVGVHAASNDYYYSCDGIANAYEIDLSNEKLYACRDKITNPVNVENLVSYTNSITKSYQVHIYHYYVPYDGYYTAYTTGSKDTKIRLYRENQILWWINGFIGFDRTEDDGSKCDNNYYNACSIEWLAKGYYYVAVRMYGTATGSYTINIGPNEDLIYRPKYPEYRVWTLSHVNRAVAPYVSVLIAKREYYSWQETLMLYWLLSDNAQLTINIGEYADLYGKPAITSKELLNLYKNEDNAVLAINIASFVIGVICTLVNAPAGVSIGASVIPALLTTAIEMSEHNYLNEIATVCGIEFEFVFAANRHIGFKMSLKKNLIVESRYVSGPTVTQVGPFVGYSLSSWGKNENYFRGVKNERGFWSKD